MGQRHAPSPFSLSHRLHIPPFLARSPRRWESSVVEADEVVGERLDAVGGVSGGVLLAVVADDDALRRLGDGDACPALWRNALVSLENDTRRLGRRGRGVEYT